MAKSLNTLDVPSATAWRSWLAEHHASVPEIWLVFHKRHTGRPTIAYTDAVDEALCFGWVDSLIRRLDEDRYARKFTPRKADSAWSTINRRRYAALLAAGRLTEAGLARSPTAKSGDAPQLAGGEVPTYIQRTLRKHPAARKFFERLAPSHQRAYLVWIDSAKREETKLNRLQQALQMLAAGRKPGMK